MQGPYPAAAGFLSCLHIVRPFCCEHIPAQSIAEIEAAMEVIPETVHRLGRVVPQHGIPPLPSPDLAWLSSTWPAPLPVAAQSQGTGGVTLALLHPEIGYSCDTLNFALQFVWEGWETAMQKRDRGKKNLEK